MRRDDPQRITDKKRLDEAQRMMTEMIELRSMREIATLLGWTPPDVSRIAHGQWKQIRVYPEQLFAMRIAYEIVKKYEKLTNEARALSEKLALQNGQMAKTSASLRRLLRKM